MKNFFLVKRENNEVSFVTPDEHGTIYVSSVPTLVRKIDLEFLEREMTETKLRKMYGAKGESLCIPSNLHRLAGMSYEKPSANFTVELFELDFSTGLTSKLLKTWKFDITKIDNDDGILPEIKIEIS